MTGDDHQCSSHFSSDQTRSSSEHVIYFPGISRKFQNKDKRGEENRRGKSNEERQSYHSLQVKRFPAKPQRKLEKQVNNRI